MTHNMGHVYKKKKKKKEKKRKEKKRKEKKRKEKKLGQIVPTF